MGTNYASSVSVSLTWTHITYQANPTDKTIEMCKNDRDVCDTVTINELIIDNAAYQHIIGVGYRGFIWQFCVFQYTKAEWEVSNPSSCLSHQCVSCPVDVCLYECAPDQTWSSDVEACVECENEPTCITCIHPIN